jgi:hypothetical protein
MLDCPAAAAGPIALGVLSQEPECLESAGRDRTVLLPGRVVGAAFCVPLGVPVRIERIGLSAPPPDLTKGSEHGSIRNR